MDTTDWRPWMDELHAHAAPLSSRYERTVEGNVVWLKWTQSLSHDKDKYTVEKAVQALELLALLSETDQKKWRSVVETTWPTLTMQWDEELDTTVLRFGVLVRATEVGVVTKVCTRFLNGTSSRAKSDYGIVRHELEAAYPGERKTLQIPVRLAFVEDPEGNDNISSIEYTVNFGDRPDGRARGRPRSDSVNVEHADPPSTVSPVHDHIVQLEEAFEGRLRETIDVIERATAAASREAAKPSRAKLTKTQKKKQQKKLSMCSWPTLFKITQMEAVGCDALHTGNIFLSELELMFNGVEQRNLRFDRADVDEDNACIYTPHLSAMLHSFGGVEPSAPQIVPTTSVGVSQCMTRQSYDSIFSAILSSPSIRTLRVGTLDMMNTYELDQQQRERLWQWMAVVFGGHLASPLEQFHLWAADLTPDDILVLEKTMRAPNPLTTLFPRASHDHEHTTPAIISASEFHLQGTEEDDDADRDALSSLVFTFHLPNIRVLEMEDEWFAVLLPGWGKAWVKRSNATNHKNNTPSVPKKPSKELLPVRHVKIDCVSERQKDTVLAFLHVVGASIKRLTLNTLETPGGPPRDTWIRHVFEACPDIEVFSAKNMPIASLETIAHIFEEGACRVNNLAIELSPSSGIASADCFLDYLADEAHSIVQHVGSLELSLTPKSSDSVISVLRAALNMLQKNRVLACLKLVFHVERGELSASELALVDRLYEHTGKLVASRLAPLPLLNKLAFLSAVTDAQTKLPVSRDSAALIFEYAAHCRSRRVRVETVNVPRWPQEAAEVGTVDSWADLRSNGCPCCGGSMEPRDD